MEFVVKLYRKQVEVGRVFVHENPAHAKSWALPVIRKMIREQGVEVVEVDQCMYGLKTCGMSRSQLVIGKTPARFMTNSRSIGQDICRKCDGSHEHQSLIDGRANVQHDIQRICVAQYAGASPKRRCRGL